LALPAIEVASSFASATVGLLALFRTDTKIEGKKFTISEVVLVAELGQAISKNQNLKDVRIVYPPIGKPDLESLKTGIFSRVSAAGELREKAESKISTLQTAKDPKAERLKALNAQFDKFVAQLSAADDKGSPALITLAKAEQFAKRLSDPETFVLAAGIQEAGGSNKTTKSLFSSNLYHSGGAVVSYILLNPAGDIVSSATLYDYTGFIEVKALEREGLLSNVRKESQ
jgi:hypothetical protein